ncbi:class I SAM-dependent methyltransferase [Limnoglobus roseus]|uniref:Methyltransferase domain-containing protein n=1 Tax=Limnoglobus roseus TaxID=2598579 RepID=A0A5C1AII7_9BACT|nr:class I SAM-dependent methyltransferase [Limnoglobus roseus]QEL18465.1 methyltransferase domain-containing protein [Limnoglobus roseus]
MLDRVLEPEAMDTEDEANDYDAMDHSAVNRAFAADFFSVFPAVLNPVLDVGTGTAQIPIELCRQSPAVQIVAVDLSEAMLKLASRNVTTAGFAGRITLERVNGRDLPYPAGRFGAVVSNSIIHHIPEPTACFAEMVRVCRLGGTLFVRDLLRPAMREELDRLVNLHAAGANDSQRALFANSLRAALTLDEVRSIVRGLGFDGEAARQTSDRHWTFAATKPGSS